MEDIEEETVGNTDCCAVCVAAVEPDVLIDVSTGALSCACATEKKAPITQLCRQRTRVWMDIITIVLVSFRESIEKVNSTR
ncbi:MULTISPECIES: hypothetical protein [Providencia]|uniref:hypothetical protein n=1 Tax=Providencia TaxID=586 RepID=UPI00234ABFC6|nr:MULTISPECIES: hypothetical protein [Providencia]